MLRLTTLGNAPVLLRLLLLSVLLFSVNTLGMDNSDSDLFTPRQSPLLTGGDCSVNEQSHLLVDSSRRQADVERGCLSGFCFNNEYIRIQRQVRASFWDRHEKLLSYYLFCLRNRNKVIAGTIMTVITLAVVGVVVWAIRDHLSQPLPGATRPGNGSASS